MNITLARLSIAQINPTVGAISENADSIIAAIRQAQNLRSDLIVFPQLALSGAPLRDHLRKNSFFQTLQEELQRIIGACQGITAIVGLPCIDDDQRIFNCAVLIHDGRLVDVICKQTVNDRPYFHETSYFCALSEPFEPTVYSLGELSCTIVLGEDIGYHLYRHSQHTAAGEITDLEPKLVINLTAHPFVPGASQLRSQYLQEIAQRNACAVAEVNLVGAQDELIFEGGSQLYSASGQLLHRAPTFEAGLITYDLTTAQACPNFADKLPYSAHNANVVLPVLSQDIKSPLLAIPPCPDQPIIEKVLQAIKLGISDYLRKNRFTDVLLGISGGIDSALVAAIAVQALGAEHVHGVYMPTCYNADISLEDSQKLCANLGMELRIIPIEKTRLAFDELLAESFQNCQPNVTEENIQVRIRAVLLMALSNKFGWLLLSTGNKSEAACGYSTLYGDTAGAISPIKDLYKTEVFALSRYINRHGEVIPERIITRPPSAELRPEQKDSDSLPEYELLDGILRLYLEQHLSPQEIIAQGFDAPTVRRVVRLVRISEFKRQQCPFGLRLSTSLLGCDYSMPITDRFEQ